MKIEGTLDSQALALGGTTLDASKILPDGTFLGTFGAGSSPNGIGFDGTNVWIANAGGTVTVLNAKTGVPASFSPLSAGTAPYTCTYDGLYMWVVSAGGTDVYVFNARTGAQASFSPVSVGANSQPTASAFDGTNIWIVNSGSSHNVEVINARTGVPASFSPIAVPASYGFVAAFDGQYMWVGIQNSSPYPLLLKIDLNGNIVGSFNAMTYPSALVFDGENMWLSGYSDNTVYVFNSAGTLIASYFIIYGLRGMTFDGTNMWVSSYNSNNVYKVSLDGQILGTFSMGGGSGPVGLCFAENGIWVADSTVGTVNKLAANVPLSPVTDPARLALMSRGLSIPAGLPSKIQFIDSAPGIGGATSEAMTVVGLRTTDTILAVSQAVVGANGEPLVGFNTQIADGLTGVWPADPGVGSVIRVAILR